MSGLISMPPSSNKLSGKVALIRACFRASRESGAYPSRKRSIAASLLGLGGVAAIVADDLNATALSEQMQDALLGT